MGLPPAPVVLVRQGEPSVSQAEVLVTPRCSGGNAGTDNAHSTGKRRTMKLTLDDAKGAARALRRGLAAADLDISHSQALEMVAHQLGYSDWNTASAVLTADRAGSGPAVPVLRIHDEALATEFYVEFLGFSIEWEHRFEADLPLYARIRRGETILDLSEHHGDGTPGGVVWIPINHVGAFHADISRRPYRRLRPGIDRTAPGGPTVEVTDPFGNTLRFCEVSD